MYDLNDLIDREGTLPKANHIHYWSCSSTFTYIREETKGNGGARDVAVFENTCTICGKKIHIPISENEKAFIANFPEKGILHGSEDYDNERYEEEKARWQKKEHQSLST